MSTGQYLIISTLVILLVASCLRLGFLISKTKYSKISDVFILFLMFGIGLVALFWVSIVVDNNEVLLLKTKNKCPEYKKIENVYILKNNPNYGKTN